MSGEDYMSGNLTSISSQPGNKSERDVTSFVKYLLEGSGVEEKIDFGKLRRELDEIDQLDSVLYSSNNSPSASQSLRVADSSSFVFKSTTTNNNTSDDIFESNVEDSGVHSHKSKPPSLPLSQSTPLCDRYTEMPSLSDFSHSIASNREAVDENLVEMSKRLVHLGLPALPAPLLVGNGKFVLELCEGFCREYERRGKMLSDMIQRVSEAEERVYSVNEKRDEEREIVRDLAVCRVECMDAKRLCEVYKERAENLQNELDIHEQARALSKEEQIEKMVYESRIKALKQELVSKSSGGDKTHALQTQISVLSESLGKKEMEIRTLKEEIDILNLGLMSNKKNNPHNKENRGKTTRELIQEDKKAWMMKTYLIEGFSDRECREMIKSVCEKFGMMEKRFMEGINDVEKALKLIPQLKDFVERVDGIAWPEYHGQPRKLEETIKKLEHIVHELSTKEALQDFQVVVCEMLELDTGTSIGNILSKLKSSLEKDMTDSEKEDLEALSQFKELFDIDENISLVTKINELYIFCVEVKSGLKRLKEVMGIDGDEAKVLLEACHKLELN